MNNNRILNEIFFNCLMDDINLIKNDPAIIKQYEKCSDYEENLSKLITEINHFYEQNFGLSFYQFSAKLMHILGEWRKIIAVFKKIDINYLVDNYRLVTFRRSRKMAN